MATDDPRIAEYAHYIESATGTIILKKIWIKYDTKNLDHTIGRTYRKFIEQGIVFEHNDNRVYLHDPLYMAGPTKFDVESAKMTVLPAKGSMSGIAIPPDVW